MQAVQVGVQITVAQVKLCKAVLDSPYAEAAFDEIVAKQTADLTKFGQGILQSRRAPEKVQTISNFEIVCGSIARLPRWMVHTCSSEKWIPQTLHSKQQKRV